MFQLTNDKILIVHIQLKVGLNLQLIINNVLCDCINLWLCCVTTYKKGQLEGKPNSISYDEVSRSPGLCMCSCPGAISCY